MNEKDQLIQLAIQLTSAEQFMEAVQALRKAFNLSPQNQDVNDQLRQTRWALFNTINKLLHRNRFAEPHKRLSAWLRQFPRDAEAQALLESLPERAKEYRMTLRPQAQDRIRIKDYQGAQMLFQNWLQQFPDDLKARSDLGQLERYVAARTARPNPRETTEAEALILRTITSEIRALNVTSDLSEPNESKAQ